MSVPVIDEKNPFYCPKIPASVYLRSLRRKVQQLSRLPKQQSPSLSFNHSLQRSVSPDASRTLETDLGSDWVLGDYFSSGRGWFSSQSNNPRRGDNLPPPYSPVDSSQAHRPLVTYRQGQRNNSPVPETAATTKLKRKNLFSDLAAPPKYARSTQSYHDSSFDLELKREVLHFSGAASSPPSPHEVTPAPPRAPPQALIEEVSLALPGIRVEERLRDRQYTSPQDIMSFLAENGYINEGILDIFSETDVESIMLAPSLFEENGLNICPQGIYSIFARPDCFQSLRELSFAGISIRDADIRYIHHLPNLSVLLLEDTSITNEAVFLLMPLKQSLSRLCLSTNPDVNNDCVPALILLSKLRYISLYDTSIDIAGLRRLAEAMNKGARNMDIEIPISCEVYVANLKTRYLYMPEAPLITDPDACAHLSLASLRRNLEAHAACNPEIVASGTRQEMLLRLTDILKTRKLDALVVDMLQE